MNADERLTALKKAYADIILNTAKEAAARILASERKALRFQHELFSVKEESLQMLMRLKRMMDSKSSEAELASVSQQKKIEELELQLQEAEDIVKDLREELREVQDELERAAKHKVAHLNQEVVASPETSADNRPDVSQSIVPTSISNMGTEGQKIYNSLIRMSSSYISKSDLPSIILRSKEPELFRNGCTQRVRACERMPLNRELTFSDRVNDEKDDLALKEVEEGERVCKAPVCGPDNKCSSEKNDVVQGVRKVRSWQQELVDKPICKKRKRTTRFPIRTSPSGYQTDQINKNNCRSGKDIFPCVAGDALDMPQKVSSDTDGKCMEDKCSDTITSAASLVNGLKDGLMSTAQEIYKSSRRSECPSDQTNVGNSDLLLVTSESKGSDTTRVIPLHPVNRVIKYTFQRKKKRDTLNSSEGNASEKLIRNEGSAFVGKQDVGKKENGSLESENSNLTEESSRDSRLLQVAQQLISISGNKWFQ